MEIERESIFVSALRSFFRSTFAVFGIAFSCCVIVLIYALLSTKYSTEDKTQVTFLADLQGSRKVVSLTAPVILQIKVHGVIGTPITGLDSETVESILVESREGFFETNRVKGVLLHFDTPGGTTTDSEDIYQQIKWYKDHYKIPVYGYIEGECASGGMLIACSADRLYCSPAGLVGSVGVRTTPFFNVADAMPKIGVQTRTFTEGRDKDMMNPFRPWKADEGESLQKVLAFYYERFVDIVTENRPQMDRQKLIDVYGANVFDPVTAQEYGYIDEANSTYQDALAALLKQANVDTSKPYQVVDLSLKQSYFSELFQSQSPLLSGKLEHVLNLGQARSERTKDRIAYLYEP